MPNKGVLGAFNLTADLDLLDTVYKYWSEIGVTMCFINGTHEYKNTSHAYAPHAYAPHVHVTHFLHVLTHTYTCTLCLQISLVLFSSYMYS